MPRLGVDPDRLVAVGLSAGGHLAATLALQADEAGLDDGSCAHAAGPEVSGAVALYAPLDLTAEAGWTCRSPSRA